MRHFMVSCLILILAVAAAMAGYVSYPTRPAGGGPITRTAVWSFGTADVGDQSLASDPLYGHVQRIVIESTGTDTAWGVTLTDAHGITLFTKADLSSASEPYSYAIHIDDLNGDPHWGVPVHGALTLATANVAYDAEVQTLALSGGDASDGTFTLTYGGATTTAIDYDATTTEIQTALTALSTVASGDITVGGGKLSEVADTTFTFAAALADVDLITMDITELGVTPEVQTLTSDDATDGTFTLTYGGQETEAIAYNASLADIKAALELLSTVEADDIAVGETTLDVTGTTTFTFRAGLGDVSMLEIDISSLTGPSSADFAETTKGVLASGTLTETTAGGADLTDITVTVYYLGNGN